MSRSGRWGQRSAASVASEERGKASTLATVGSKVDAGTSGLDRAQRGPCLAYWTQHRSSRRFGLNAVRSNQAVQVNRQDDDRQAGFKPGAGVDAVDGPHDFVAEAFCTDEAAMVSAPSGLQRRRITRAASTAPSVPKRPTAGSAPLASSVVTVPFESPSSKRLAIPSPSSSAHPK